LEELKLNIIDNLGLNLANVSQLRVRSLGKRMDPERIIRGNKTPIKKFNIDNPANLIIEILDKEEELKENQIQLVIWQRDAKTYKNGKEMIFEFSQFAGSDQLYKQIRDEFGITSEFKIAKYAKQYYTWEEIKERDIKNNAINLRKGPYNLKDGDWIGVSCEDGDDFMTEEDSKMANVVKLSVGPTCTRKRRASGKLLRIVTDF
jgi:hypothetical protein